MKHKHQKFGATGEYPRGSLGPTDLGALKVGIAHDSKGNVILNFGTEVSWIGLPPEQAIDFAKTILKHAGATKIEITFGSFKATSTAEKKDEPPADTG